MEKADARLGNNAERTALHLALVLHEASRPRSQIVARLLAANADVNAKDVHGATALHMATQKGPVTLLRTPLAANADVNVANTAGVTPLHEAVARGHPLIVEMLLAAKANVSLVAHSKKRNGTALLLARLYGYENIQKLPKTAPKPG